MRDEDIQSITPDNINKWAQQAPPEQVVQATHRLLDKVAGYPDQDRQTFSRSLNSGTRGKLFQNEPVG